MTLETTRLSKVLLGCTVAALTVVWWVSSTVIAVLIIGVWTINNTIAYACLLKHAFRLPYIDYNVYRFSVNPLLYSPYDSRSYLKLNPKVSYVVFVDCKKNAISRPGELGKSTKARQFCKLRCNINHNSAEVMQESVLLTLYQKNYKSTNPAWVIDHIRFNCPNDGEVSAYQLFNKNYLVTFCLTTKLDRSDQLRQTKSGHGRAEVPKTPESSERRYRTFESLVSSWRLPANRWQLPAWNNCCVSKMADDTKKRAALFLPTPT